MNKIEHKEFIEKLLAFLEEGFQNPIQIINYLQSRNKCKNPKCEAKTCKPLIPYFKGKKVKRPWNRDTLNKFDELRQKWYKSGQSSYEEPINGFFTLPRIAQFLEDEIRLSSYEISDIFKMEFKGKGKSEFFVPNCLWKGKKGEYTAIKKECIGKRMCCDFYFINYKKNNKSIPNLVGEIKIAVHVPHQRQIIWNEFKKDIEKCKEWLKPETSACLVERFNIIKFDYALAILIDLTGGETYSKLWNSEMKQMEEKYLKERVFVRLIQPKKEKP